MSGSHSNDPSLSHTDSDNEIYGEISVLDSAHNTDFVPDSTILTETQKMAQLSGPESPDVGQIHDLEQPSLTPPIVVASVDQDRSTQVKGKPVENSKASRGPLRRWSIQNNSPSLRRAGLLQPVSTSMSYSGNNPPSHSPPVSGSATEERPEIRSRISTSSSSTSPLGSGGSFMSAVAPSSPRLSSSVNQTSHHDGRAGHSHTVNGARVVPHSQDTIRDNTMQLTGMLLRATPASFSSSSPMTHRSQPSEFTPTTFTPHSFSVFDSSIRVEPRSVGNGPAREGLEENRNASASHELNDSEQLLRSHVDDLHSMYSNYSTSRPDHKNPKTKSDDMDAQTSSAPFLTTLFSSAGAVVTSDDSSSPKSSDFKAYKSGLSLLLNPPSSPSSSSSSPSPSPTPRAQSPVQREQDLSSQTPSASSTNTALSPSLVSLEADQGADLSLRESSDSPTPTSTFVGSPYPAPRPPARPHEGANASSPTPLPASRKPKAIRWDPALDAHEHTRYNDYGSTSNSWNTHGETRHHDSETTPLLTPPTPSPFHSFYAMISRKLKTVPSPPTPAQFEQVVKDTAQSAVRAIPAVILGCLLNILDGVSYGMIIFPTSAPFTDLGPMGVSMFFVSCVISQLCYTLGGSGFAGANGSMMIEVVPFFHILATSIAREIGEDKPAEVIATTIVAYALSSVLTGLSFFLLGALKLGVIIGFFPRHILVGCIGGVGAFLMETGLTVSMRIPDDDFTIDFDTLKFIFEPHTLALWTIPLGLAIFLRIITSRWRHQLVFPVYFVIVPIVFYVIVAAARLNLSDLREAGWLFDIPGEVSGEKESWYKFYTYFDTNLIHVAPLWSTLPTQFALLFFNILHPPLNVPALSVSLNEDVDTDRELVAHGYSNLLAGCFGTVPNYLVYVNTLLFYRVGGSTRIAGFLLAVATAILLLLGTGPIAYIPVSVVGALIFVLGIDLIKEALWDTRHRVSRMEYITIASIMVAMTVWDFVIGVLFGIVVSCFFFVVQNSQRRSIRAIHTGETAMSTVRRPSAQRAYIKEVSKMTMILRLQGFLFFGTITYVEEAIRNVIDGPSWGKNPIRFLVLDLSLVYGIDMSSAEAFVRILRLLNTKYVTMVFCGFEAESAVGKALQSVDVLGAEGVELFSTFNDAMEWTENAYLKAWYRSQKPETAIPFILPGRRNVDITYQSSVVGSPRRTHLFDAGVRTIASDVSLQPTPEANTEPYSTLARTFSSFGDFTYEQFRPLVSRLRRMSVPEGYVLWKQDEPSDGLYLIESGILRASYQFSNHTQHIEESMVPGTLAGELSALSNMSRNATVVAERPAVLWKLSTEDLRHLEAEEPALARMFTQMVLKSAKIDYDILLSALASRQ